MKYEQQTYDGDIILPSLRLVFGCFCMVSSWPSNVFKYWICCGDGTGIKLGSLFVNVELVLAEDTDVDMPCFCCAKDCKVRPNIPSESKQNYQ